MRARSTTTQAGSTVIWSMLMLTVLATVGSTVLFSVTRRYNGIEKTGGWQEALTAAESGADLAMANLRWTVVSGSPTPFASANGWTTTTATGNTIYTCTTPTIQQTGEGTVQTWSVITVDGPTAKTPAGLVDNYGNQWYRIRSTGHARVPGRSVAAFDLLKDVNTRRTNSLRKFNLRVDRATGGALVQPEATRTVEIMVQPCVKPYPAIVARTTLNVQGPKQLIDSYDSRDATKSTNGQYDPAKRQSNAGLATDGSAKNSITLAKDEMIYGNVSTNGASFTDPNNTIQGSGTINNSTNIPLSTIPVPTWGMAGSPAINNSLTTVTSAKTITASTDGTQNYYKLTDINAPLNINLPAGATTATVNIWLTNNCGGSGTITVQKGVTVNVYFTGDTFHPNNVGAVDNQNLDPSMFNFYGCGTDAGGGAGIDIHVGGTGTQNFYGTVYAPYRTINLKYDGKTNYDPSSAAYGTFVGNVINIQSSVHYDEALSAFGSTVDYARASYVEDPR